MKIQQKYVIMMEKGTTYFTIAKNGFGPLVD